MELIYTTPSGVDENTLHNYSFDHESGLETSKNTFEIKVALDNAVLDIGKFVYIPDTEFGGRVDSVKIDTKNNEIVYTGKTWRGLLGNKIISPSSGQDYYVESGRIKAILNRVITRISLNNLFVVSDEGADINVPSFQFDRYIDAFKGLTALTKSVNFKLDFKWSTTLHKIVINAVPIEDYSNSREITSDMFTFVIEKKSTVNHMIGLGKGDLRERQVVHKYLDENGNVSNTQYYFGADEVAKIYDYSNVESLAELNTKTAEELEKNIIKDSVSIMANDNIVASLGDKFTVKDIAFGVTATQYVNGIITIITETSYNQEISIGEWIR